LAFWNNKTTLRVTLVTPHFVIHKHLCTRHWTSSAIDSAVKLWKQGRWIVGVCQVGCKLVVYTVV
jgi:hypothetical protein